MKKISTCLLLSLLISGCSFNFGLNTSTSTNKINVESVKISYDGSLDVICGDKIRAHATVVGEGEKRVDWISSDESLARVENGYILFYNVQEDKKVTITAQSSDDPSVKDSREFTINYCKLNLKNSRGNYDNSTYLEDGVVSVENGNTALMFNGVYGTKWYVEADITPLDLGTEKDQSPKFGIMAGTSELGFYNSFCKNVFYYVDAKSPMRNDSWTSLGFVGQNSTNSGWASFNKKEDKVTLNKENAVTVNEPFKMGMLRDGTTYYLFATMNDEYKVVKQFENASIPATEDSYAWIGGWSSGYSVSNVKTLLNDDVNQML